jgi:hypothetical protein
MTVIAVDCLAAGIAGFITPLRYSASVSDRAGFVRIGSEDGRFQLFIIRLHNDKFDLIEPVDATTRPLAMGSEFLGWTHEPDPRRYRLSIPKIDVESQFWISRLPLPSPDAKSVAINFGSGTIQFVRGLATVNSFPLREDRLTCLSVVLPAWFLVCLLGILPAYVWTSHFLTTRKRRRMGLCPKCGYDLRATPDRCPECGTVIPTGE